MIDKVVCNSVCVCFQRLLAEAGKLDWSVVAAQRQYADRQPMSRGSSGGSPGGVVLPSTSTIKLPGSQGPGSRVCTKCHGCSARAARSQGT